MSNVAKIEGPVSHPPALTESAAVLSIIERASRDPAVDIDKLQRLMEMRETIETKIAERAFNAAMKVAQSEMRPISADATNSQTRSKYATYAKLDSALRPIYTKHGFALSFDEADSPKPDHIRVLCYVSHDAGFTRTYHKDMPADGKGAKGGDVMTKTHASGAASSYGARYLVKGIFNVAVGEDDHDGSPPSDNQFVSEEQIATLEALIQEVGADQVRFCAHLKVPELAQIREKDFRRAIDALNSKRRAAQ